MVRKVETKVQNKSKKMKDNDNSKENMFHEENKLQDIVIDIYLNKNNETPLVNFHV